MANPTTYEELQAFQKKAATAGQREVGHQQRLTTTHRSKRRLLEESARTQQEIIREQNRTASFQARQQIRSADAANSRYQRQAEHQGIADARGQQKVLGTGLGQLSDSVQNLGSGLLHAGPDPRKWTAVQKGTAIIGGIFGLIFLYIMLTPAPGNTEPNAKPRGVALVDGVYGVSNALISGKPMFTKLPNPNAEQDAQSNAMISAIGTSLGALGTALGSLDTALGSLGSLGGLIP